MYLAIKSRSWSLILGRRGDLTNKSELIFVVGELLAIEPPRFLGEEVSNFCEVLKVRLPFKLHGHAEEGAESFR